MGEKYVSLGLDDFLVEFGVYGVGVVLVLMKGKVYNCGVYVYKFLMEVFFCLLW